MSTAEPLAEQLRPLAATSDGDDTQSERRPTLRAIQIG
jgi:hypothetical protein